MLRRTSRRGLATVAALGATAAVAGCGGGEAGKIAPRTVTAVALPQTPAVRDAPVADGKRIFEAIGCLACHQIFTKGNSGPGNSLTSVGARMTPAEIRRALVDGKSPPMPSFRELGRQRLDDLVAYLSALQGNTPGGPPCPDDADCG